ncbi:hypothetical protein RJZ56_006034 [Blastomyces dermatitidis]|uniref:Uncharacterized protein n=1 Tax=Blastomyces gilchristii (strain SLH14081) TaxID=559298 RepID=A0A179V2R2_BLAGS|nr:uncharacterized protein BDBG_08848 [Blastomyces gilchristii SLH14081]EQL28264.1 hypothetical protein BDFG_08994 [Blastomyces dermatitidis ATCC 26199]OAT13697.1 hypothetical protein BDBG_08848 [Blastomyces gilchristii SLH14081]
MNPTTTRKNDRLQQQQPTPQYSDDEDLDYFSGDDYEEDYDDTPIKRQPQRRTAQRLLPRQSLQKERQNDRRQRPMKTASAQSEDKAMQPLERIGPPETSMDGPVTYARAQRGEIPMRDGNPNQKLNTAEKHQEDEQDGLKLKLELNLDIEVELKASIHGDLTLALL